MYMIMNKVYNVGINSLGRVCFLAGVLMVQFSRSFAWTTLKRPDFVAVRPSSSPTLSRTTTTTLFVLQESKKNLVFDEQEEEEVDFDSLIDTDVVIYTPTNNKNDSDGGNQPDDDNQQQLLLGAIQEDGVLSPLSVWTTEPAFGDSIEFLVDEEDRFSLDMANIKLLKILDESELSYGSRQCKRGVHNPHGEESEILYYIDQDVLDKYCIDVIVKPDLEILW